MDGIENFLYWFKYTHVIIRTVTILAATWIIASIIQAVQSGSVMAIPSLYDLVLGLLIAATIALSLLLLQGQFEKRSKL